MLILSLLSVTVVIALLSGLTLWYDRPQRVSDALVDAELFLAEEREPISPALGPLEHPPSAVEASSTPAHSPELVFETGALSVSFEGATGGEAGTEIAVLDGETGRLLASRQLRAEETTLQFANLPIGTHWLVNYSSESSPRYDYNRRVPVEIRTGVVVQRSLSLQTCELKITLIETGKGKLPTGKVVTILERSDDPSWRRALAITPSSDPKGVQLNIQGLGPGNYLLSVPGFQVEGGEKTSLQVRGRTELVLPGTW